MNHPFMSGMLTGVLLAGAWGAGHAAVAAAAQRPLTYAELTTLKVTAPVLRLVGDASTLHAYSVWADYGDRRWTLVFSSGEVPVDAFPKDRPPEFHILLSGMPRAVRVGVSGNYTGPALVDHLELILPDGARLAPSRLLPVNSVTNPKNAAGADGKVAVIAHTAPLSPAVPTVIDGVDAFFDQAPDRWRDAKQQLPAVQAPVPRFGVYYYPRIDTDPHEALLDWAYQPDPASIAFYDFGMPQDNASELFAKVKAINPQQKIIARLTWPVVNPLDYAYDPAVKASILAAIRQRLAQGTEQLYGVYLGDEEPQHFYAGWYAKEMPEWVKRHRADYEREVPGKPFDWNSRDLREWIIGKGPPFFNDIYDMVKALDPKLRVLPFLYTPGDTSGWGFWDPKLIKADGWVVQWFDPDSYLRHPLRVPVTHAAGITSVWVMETWFNLKIRQLLDRGIPVAEIYCQVWAYQPGDDAVTQSEKVLAAGVGNLWVFYEWAWIPPPPRTTGGARCLAFKLYAAGQPAPWLAQTTVDSWAPVGNGVAQRFVAGTAGLGNVALQLRSKDRNSAAQVVLYEDNDGLPGAMPLAAAPLTLPAGTDGWVELPLAAPTKVGQPYYLAVVPRDPKTPVSGIQVAVSERTPYAGGDLISRTVVPGYFDGWQSCQSNARWISTYRQRLEFERYIQWWRGK